MLNTVIWIWDTHAGVKRQVIWRVNKCNTKPNGERLKEGRIIITASFLYKQESIGDRGDINNNLFLSELAKKDRTDYALI